MKPLVIGTDLASVMAASARNQKKSTLDNPFDDLFARAARSAQGAGDLSAVQGQPDPLKLIETQPQASTPAALFEQTLKASGAAPEQVSIPASDRPRLEELLAASGYREDDIKQMLDQASSPDGSINLGVMFSLMHRYVPQEGPHFWLKVEDKPLLVQVLKGLGIPEEEINKFMEGLQVKGDRVRVKGLPALMAKAGQAKLDKGQEVDRQVLGDLLARLGLEQKDIDSLLAKGTDGQGRANPRAVLAMLQSAANRQDNAVLDALKDLAQRARFNAGPGTQPADGERLRAQFIKLMERVEARTKDQGLSLQQALAEAAKAMAKEGDSLLLSAASRLVKAELGSAAGQAVAGAAEAAPQGQAGAAGQQASGNPQGQTGGEAGRGRPGPAPVDAAPKAPQAAPGSAAQTGRPAAGGEPALARAPLPAYVVRQVGQQMVQMVSKQQTTLVLELKPPSLGELNLEIAVKDGVVRATMVAESVAAKQALESGMEQLKAQLASQGLKLGEVQIIVNPDAQRQHAQAQAGDQFHEGRQARGQGDAGPAGTTPEQDEQAALVAAMSPPESGRINLFA